MAGVKRKSASEGVASHSASKPKKIKTNLAVKPVKNGVSKAKSSKRAPPPPEEEMIESDTTEDENPQGFSANSEAEANGDHEDASSEEDLAEVKPKKSKTAWQGKDRNNDKADSKTLLTSRETHAKQKALAKERKASRPNADQTARAKKIWERLRIKSNVPKEERNKLVAELFEIVTGRVKEFVFKHDSVRTIQCALKYATMPQRVQIAEELKGEFRGLVESKYSKFLVAKLITEGNEQIRDLIVQEFYGHVRKLINHPEASWILDDVYRQVANASQKARLLREWYGTEFALANKSDKANEGAPSADLGEILKATPDKRKPIMDNLQFMIDQLIQKKLTGFTILHDAMLQYYLNIQPDSPEAGDFRTLMIGDKEEEEVDLMRNLAFTKPGSRLVCLALAHGSSKDRRQILRAYKDTMEMMAFDKNGYLVLVTAFTVIDDTREINSRIFSELVLATKSATPESQAEKILALADHLSGHTVLLYPIVGPAKWLVPADAQQRLAEIVKIRETTSKKDPAVRQSELTALLSPPLLAAIASNAETLSQTPFGCTLIREVLFAAPGDKSAALDAVADLAKGDPTEESHIANSAVGCRTLKSLVAGGPFDPASRKTVQVDPPLNFHDKLYQAIEGHLLEWATGMGSLIVVALMESEGFSQKDALKRTLKKNIKVLKKAATEETAVQKKAKATEADDQEKGEGGKQGNKGKKAKKPTKEAIVGNRGAQILLEML